MNTRAQEYLDNLYITDANKMIDFLNTRAKNRAIFDREKIYNVKKYLHNLAVK